MKPRNPMSLAARGRKLLALSLGVRRRNYFSTLNGRDAKVSRQPEQLEEEPDEEPEREPAAEGA